MVKIELADFPKDNSSLLSFSKKHPSIGQISLYQDRSPNYYSSLSPEGEIKQVVIGRDLENDKIMGAGHRTESNFLIYGNKTRLGMLSGLKLDPNYKATTALPRGYKLFRELDSQGSSLGYFTTIQSENFHSIQVLESGKAGLPKYQFIADLITYTFSRNSFKIFSNRHRQTSPKFVNSMEDPTLIPRIYDFLIQESKKYSVTPDYSYLMNLEFGEIIYFALEDDQRIRFCFGLWNQTSNKNWIVQNYNFPINVLRPFYNLLTIFNSYPKMPKEKQSIPNQFISFLGIRDSEEYWIQELFGLFNYAFEFSCQNKKNLNQNINSAIYTLTLDSESLLNQFLKKIPSWIIHSRAYFVYWEGNEESQEIYNKIKSGHRIWEVGCL